MHLNKKLMSLLLCMFAVTTCNLTFAQLANAKKNKGPAEQSVKAKEAPAPAAAKAADKTNAKAALVDINSASKEELMKIAGVGTRYSDEIIKGRPYKSKNQLVSKKILPDVLYKTISDKIIAKRGSSK